MLWESKFYKDIPYDIIDGIYYIDNSNKIDYWEKEETIINKLLEYKKIYGIKKRLSFYIEYDKNIDIQDKIDNAIEKSILSGIESVSDVYIFEKDKISSPILIRVSPLPNNEENIISIIEIFTPNSKKIGFLKIIQKLIETGNYDYLTYTANSDFLYKIIESKIDNYKRFNDLFGYLLLNISFTSSIESYDSKILRLIGTNILRNIRTIDISGRVDGNNFFSIISHIKDWQLIKIAERLKNNLENTDFIIDDFKINIKISNFFSLIKSNDSLTSIKEKIQRYLK